MDSKNYPKTTAILVQPAEYQFVRIDPRTGQIQQMPGQGQGQGQFQQIPGQGQNWLISMPPNTGAQPPVMQPGQGAPNQGQGGQVQVPQQGQQQQAPAQKQGQRQGQAPTQQQQKPTAGIDKFEQQVIDLTNVQRQQNGLPPLKADTKLSGVAEKKSIDMQQKNYFSHTSPTYGSPFDMMRDFGVTYRSAGENIAMGQRTPQEVVQAWMNSEGHRQNILNRDFTHIGVGFEQGGYYWTQMFISK
ncbi:SCP-like extracellular protein [Neobacillus notoginsengisoli]|uniref:SCP-like extracellular protein n=1 Tax=Neobacillus notoginsengisoli TaxID=1578198 RepID=A0A417YWU5_9BACI|nr:CAP domain-containing protein [Neobacillus notoginsengisoli]RHW41738.1 SCP-like extracellular protein [Neobacillus notoginsengisoli]